MTHAIDSVALTSWRLFSDLINWGHSLPTTNNVSVPHLVSYHRPNVRLLSCPALWTPSRCSSEAPNRILSGLITSCRPPIMFLFHTLYHTLEPTSHYYCVSHYELGHPPLLRPLIESYQVLSPPVTCQRCSRPLVYIIPWNRHPIFSATPAMNFVTDRQTHTQTYTHTHTRTDILSGLYRVG